WPGATPAMSSFKTTSGSALDLSAVFTFGNINFLKTTNTIIPYVSAGGGFISYKPKTIASGSTTEVAYDNGNAQSNLFIPVGAGLKISLSQLMNLDLGYRMNFVTVLLGLNSRSANKLNQEWYLTIR